MKYTTLSQVYYSTKQYFEKGSLDDFLVMLGILVAKNHSCFSDFEDIPKDDQKVIEKRMYDTLKPFWRVIKKDTNAWAKYSLRELRTNLLNKVIYKIKEEDRIKIVQIFTVFSINTDGIVSINRPPTEKLDILTDFNLSEEDNPSEEPTPILFPESKQALFQNWLALQIAPSHPNIAVSFLILASSPSNFSLI